MDSRLSIILTLAVSALLVSADTADTVSPFSDAPVVEVEMAARNAFVQKLNIGNALQNKWLTAIDAQSGARGAVNKGSLVSFASGVRKQYQGDLLDATLLAQLAADAAVPEKYEDKNTQQWYFKYREVLQNIGFVVQSFDFTKYQASGSAFTVQKAFFDLLKTLTISPNAKAAMLATLDSLKSLSDSDGRVTLFERNTHTGNKGNFQLGVAEESNGLLVFNIAAFQFDTSQTVTKVLWFTFKTASTKLQQSGQAMTLNNNIYSRVRDQIRQKLGKASTDYIKDLDIKI